MLTVNARDLDPGSMTRLRTVLATDLVALARGSSGPNTDIVYRDLRPTDLNSGTLIGRLDNPVLTADTLNTDIYSTWANLTQNQAVGITALADVGPVPLIDEVQFVAAPTTIGICVVTQAWTNSVDARAFFIDPPVWVPQEHVQVNLLSHAGGAVHADGFQWQGVIAENMKTVGAPRTLLPPLGPGLPARVPGHV